MKIWERQHLKENFVEVALDWGINEDIDIWYGVNVKSQALWLDSISKMLGFGWNLEQKSNIMRRSCANLGRNALVDCFS